MITIVVLISYTKLDGDPIISDDEINMYIETLWFVTLNVEEVQILKIMRHSVTFCTNDKMLAYHRKPNEPC